MNKRMVGELRSIRVSTRIIINIFSVSVWILNSTGTKTLSSNVMQCRLRPQSDPPKINTEMHSTPRIPSTKLQRKVSQITIPIQVVPGVSSIQISAHLLFHTDIEYTPQQEHRWHINSSVAKSRVFSRKKAV